MVGREEERSEETGFLVEARRRGEKDHSMIRLKELDRLQAIMEELKELSKSPIPVVNVHVKIMIVTLHELLRQVHPDYLDRIVDYE